MCLKVLKIKLHHVGKNIPSRFYENAFVKKGVEDVKGVLSPSHILHSTLTRSNLQFL